MAAASRPRTHAPGDLLRCYRLAVDDVARRRRRGWDGELPGLAGQQLEVTARAGVIARLTGRWGWRVVGHIDAINAAMDRVVAEVEQEYGS